MFLAGTVVLADLNQLLIMVKLCFPLCFVHFVYIYFKLKFFVHYYSGTRSSHCHHYGVCGFSGCHGDPGCLPNPFHSSPRWKYKRRSQRGQRSMGRLCPDHHCQPNGGYNFYADVIRVKCVFDVFLTTLSCVLIVLWISYGHLCRHGGWGGGGWRGSGDAWRRQRWSANHHQEGG